jgi:hypothetical protein
MQDEIDFALRMGSRLLEQVAPGVARLDIAFVNAYLVGAPG